MPQLKPSAQYNDWQGTAAADNADLTSIGTHLRKQGAIGPKDIVVGIKVFSSAAGFEVTALSVENSKVDAYNQALEEGNVLPLKEVKTKLDAGTFLALFKSLHISLSLDGDIEGREYSET